MPSRYALAVQLLAVGAFGYVIFGYLNSRFFHLLSSPDGEAPFWLSAWTEMLVIGIFGLWRTLAERNPYTRKRLAFLTAAVVGLWWLLPYYLRVPEPFIGALPGQPILPQIHTPGTSCWNVRACTSRCTRKSTLTCSHTCSPHATPSSSPRVRAPRGAWLFLELICQVSWTGSPFSSHRKKRPGNSGIVRLLSSEAATRLSIAPASPYATGRRA
jgi:hypothetical protein